MAEAKPCTVQTRRNSDLGQRSEHEVPPLTKKLKLAIEPYLEGQIDILSMQSLVTGQTLQSRVGE